VYRRHALCPDLDQHAGRVIP